MADALVPQVAKCLKKGVKNWKAKKAQGKVEKTDELINAKLDQSDTSDEDGEVSDNKAEDEPGSNPPVEDRDEDETGPAVPGTYSLIADEDPLEGTPNGPEAMGPPGIASSVNASLSNLNC